MTGLRPRLDLVRRSLLLGGHSLADRDLAPGDRVARGIFLACSLAPLAVVAFLAAEMAWQAIPAFRYSGLALFTGQVFSAGDLYATTLGHHNGVAAPPGAQYGALPLIFGTLVSSLGALLVALPVAVGAALALAELLPRWTRGVLSMLLEFLAGIPSVAYGFWGILFLGPYLASHFYPGLQRTLSVIPFFQGPVGAGEGLLTTCLVLALMIVPIVAATTRELIRTVPRLAKDGALALGMTRYEAVRAVTIPYVRRGILGAAVLGWARALGETMAVLMISGSLLNRFPENVYGAFSSIAATIASLLDSALTDATGMAVHALAALGCVLLFITLSTNLLARALVRHGRAGAGLPIGRGI